MDLGNLGFLVLEKLEKVSEEIQKAILGRRREEVTKGAKRHASERLKARDPWDG